MNVKSGSFTLSAFLFLHFVARFIEVAGKITTKVWGFAIVAIFITNVSSEHEPPLLAQFYSSFSELIPCSLSLVNESFIVLTCAAGCPCQILTSPTTLKGSVER